MNQIKNPVYTTILKSLNKQNMLDESSWVRAVRLSGEIVPRYLLFFNEIAFLIVKVMYVYFKEKKNVPRKSYHLDCLSLIFWWVAFQIYCCFYIIKIKNDHTTVRPYLSWHLAFSKDSWEPGNKKTLGLAKLVTKYLH